MRGEEKVLGEMREVGEVYVCERINERREEMMGAWVRALLLSGLSSPASSGISKFLLPHVVERREGRKGEGMESRERRGEMEERRTRIYVLDEMRWEGERGDDGSFGARELLSGLSSLLLSSR